MFDAHDRVFAFFEGTCRRSIYDTMSTVVDMVFVGEDRAYNRRLVQISGESYRLKDKRRAGIMARPNKVKEKVD